MLVIKAISLQKILKKPEGKLNISVQSSHNPYYKGFNICNKYVNFMCISSYIGRGGGGDVLINHQILNNIPNKPQSYLSEKKIIIVRLVSYFRNLTIITFLLLFLINYQDSLTIYATTLCYFCRESHKYITSNIHSEIKT